MPGRTWRAREGRTGLCWALPWSLSLRSVSRQPREETEVGLFPTDVPDRGPLGGQALWQGSPHLSPPCFPLASLGAPHLLSQASRPQLCRGHTCLQGTPASSRGRGTSWIRSGGFMTPPCPALCKMWCSRVPSLCQLLKGTPNLGLHWHKQPKALWSEASVGGRGGRAAGVVALSFRGRLGCRGGARWCHQPGRARLSRARASGNLHSLLSRTVRKSAPPHGSLALLGVSE